MAARLTTATSPSSRTTSARLSQRLSAIISENRSPQQQKQLLRAIARTDGYSAYEGKPVEFITEILDEQPWSIQTRIAESVRDNPSTAVPSCFGSGKDWIAARIAVWWVVTGGIVVATSNSFPQLRDIFWRELRKAHSRGELPGHPSNGTDLRWEGLPDGSFAIGRKPEDTDQEGFQGFHGRRILVIVDEANGVSQDLWKASNGLVVNEASRRLAIGNPYEPQGPFFEACRLSTWHVIHISVFDTPNFTGEPVPDKAKDELVSPFWLEQRRAEGLEGTPWWQAKVLGQFPDTASNAVVPLAWVEAARERQHTEDLREWAGLDVARFGNDDSVRIDGNGNGPWTVEVRHGHDTMEVAGLGMAYLVGRRGTLAIDVIGVGAGVYDRIHEQRPPGDVLAVNVGEAPDHDPDLLVNLRAQLWWDVRLALDPRSPDPLSLARLDDASYQRLRSELTAPTYRMTSAGKVQIESKEELKARGLPSPDLADAFCLALYARSRARRRVSSFGAAA
jgi:phage terminase large subunit